MPKWCHNNVQDAALAYLKANVSAYHLCSSQPADFAGVAAVSLGSASLDLSAVVIANGDIDGRKLTIPGTTIEAAAAGSVACVALVSADTLLYVDPLDALLAVSLAEQVQLPAWDIEIGAPV